jgi:hypothetical protein
VINTKREEAKTQEIRFVGHLAGSLEKMEDGRWPIVARDYLDLAVKLENAVACFHDPLAILTSSFSVTPLADVIANRHFDRCGFLYELPFDAAMEIKRTASAVLAHASRRIPLLSRPTYENEAQAALRGLLESRAQLEAADYERETEALMAKLRRPPLRLPAPQGR